METTFPTSISLPESQTQDLKISQVTTPAEILAYQKQLCLILQACVNEGSSVGFLAPLSIEEASSYWDDVSILLQKGNLYLFILTSATTNAILGTVQLVTIPKLTHGHRAEVVKLLVQPSARRLGIARKLMEKVEDFALGLGKQFLTLDTATLSPAVEMYRRLGWEEWGTCGDYASWPDGSRCDATFFRKELSPRKSEGEGIGQGEVR